MQVFTRFKMLARGGHHGVFDRADDDLRVNLLLFAEYLNVLRNGAYVHNFYGSISTFAFTILASGRRRRLPSGSSITAATSPSRSRPIRPPGKFRCPSIASQNLLYTVHPRRR